MAKEFLDKIKITFVSLNSEIINEVNNIFPSNNPKYKNIIAMCQNISTCVSHDCIVSPTNSFGQMDRGIDRTLSNLLMQNYDFDYIGHRVREVIQSRYSGEQPVGTCILLQTGSTKYPYLAHAPTMTIPTNVVGTLNAYYAFKSILESIVQLNRDNKYYSLHTLGDKNDIKSILTTTFCTGCGEMSVRNSLIQMKKAFDVVYEGVPPTWDAANILASELRHIKRMGYTPAANRLDDNETMEKVFIDSKKNN
jgi:O-acetyl-ADP-ribose deacetylase (regulator of RNase III)